MDTESLMIYTIDGDDENEETFTSFGAQKLYGVDRNMETRYSLIGIGFIVKSDLTLVRSHYITAMNPLYFIISCSHSL